MTRPSTRIRLAAAAITAALFAFATAASHREPATQRRSSPAIAESVLGPAPSAEAARGTPPTPASTAGRGRPERRGRRPSARATSGESTRALARVLAREFLGAFLTYERGRRTRAVARALARSATAPLARTLLAAPARRPPGRHWPPLARVRRLTVIGPSAGRLKALAVLDRAGRRSVLELHLRRRGGGNRWRVAELG